MDEANLEEETSSPNSSPAADFPKKNRHRQRAHCNPLSDSFIAYPANPSHVNWPKLYPTGPETTEYVKFNTVEHPEDYSSPTGSEGFPKVSILDVGCGYGGLLVHLSTLYPDKLSLGMEIREKVTNFVGKRILSLRRQHAGKVTRLTLQYRNIAVVRTNSMKFLTNYIGKDQIFFCFPDPHFKRGNLRRRIVNYPLLSLYAYVLKTGARVYIDVFELYTWMENALDQHPLFERLADSDKDLDECFQTFDTQTEEGIKNLKNNVTTYKNVYYRV